MNAFPPLDHQMPNILNIDLLIPDQIINGINQVDLHPHNPLLDLLILLLGLLHPHIQLCLFLCNQIAQPTLL